eukprot:TRINITY_DN2976_c0_g1_i1.p1 TRINITY_DN2976_c0_g1~~TRINITY_DN2976_c0_g1_i1.p1  ORF type:complete len:299 (+),score=43.52 TRINITY_DN2976_c0_g1_i1:239-1135(+)
MLRTIAVVSCFIALAFAHSQMRCLHWVNGQCLAGIRDETNSFNTQSSRLNQTYPQVCQTTPGSPLSAKYPTGASPMGNFAPGATLTVMWYARNHATPDQNPRNIIMYLSPVGTDTKADPDYATFKQVSWCTNPFESNCGPTGDAVPCTASCSLPSSLTPGYYTALWQWDWTINDGFIYTTCADFQVSADGNTGQTGTPNPATSTSQQQNPTSQQNPSTSQQQNPVTSTSQQNPGTTEQQISGSGPASCVSQCVQLCGSDGVAKCSCANGFDVACNSPVGSSASLIAASLFSLIAALFL